MKKIFVFIISVVSSLAHASPDWTDSESISEILINPNYGSVFIKQSTMISPITCTKTGFYELNKNNPMYKDLYSFLLASYMAKKPIEVYLSQCGPSGYIEITQVRSK